MARTEEIKLRQENMVGKAAEEQEKGGHQRPKI
jgi:hypothetical protein